MNTIKYASPEQAAAVAKEAVWLAWNAAGGPYGMGYFQNRPEADKDAVWDQAYEMRDYALRHGTREDVNCDYVFGRMMKLRFKIKGDSLEVPDHECRGDYQAWCHKYKTYAALFDAALASVEGENAKAA